MTFSIILEDRLLKRITEDPEDSRKNVADNPLQPVREVLEEVHVEISGRYLPVAKVLHLVRVGFYGRQGLLQETRRMRCRWRYSETIKSTNQTMQYWKYN